MQPGGFSEESLKTYQLFLNGCAELLGDTGGVYDFARCVRPDGSTYGTKGRCKPPNKPMMGDTPEQPDSEGGDLPSGVKKVNVSMGGYSVDINVNAKDSV